MKKIIGIVCLIFSVGCGWNGLDIKNQYLYHSSGTGIYYEGQSMRTNIMCERSLKYCYRQASNICGGPWNIVSGPNMMGTKTWTITVECK